MRFLITASWSSCIKSRNISINLFAQNYIAVLNGRVYLIIKGTHLVHFLPEVQELRNSFLENS